MQLYGNRLFVGSKSYVIYALGSYNIDKSYGVILLGFNRFGIEDIT